MTGKELSRIRGKLKWTQAQLAEAVGVASNTVARWERAEMAIPEPAARLIKILFKQKGGKKRG